MSNLCAREAASCTCSREQGMHPLCSYSERRVRPDCCPVVIIASSHHGSRPFAAIHSHRLAAVARSRIGMSHTDPSAASTLSHAGSPSLFRARCTRSREAYARKTRTCDAICSCATCCACGLFGGSFASEDRPARKWRSWDCWCRSPCRAQPPQNAFACQCACSGLGTVGVRRTLLSPAWCGCGVCWVEEGSKAEAAGSCVQTAPEEQLAGRLAVVELLEMACALRLPASSSSDRIAGRYMLVRTAG